MDKEQAKKKILIVAFENLSGLFDLSYEQKLKFGNDCNDDCIYLQDINGVDFNNIFYLMYSKCFIKYLEKLHAFKNNRIDSDIYTICKLAYLNDDKEVITSQT